MPLQLTLPNGEVTSDVDKFDLAWKLHRVLAERDRLEAAIDRHMQDSWLLAEPGAQAPPPDKALYATLREIREARLADAPPGGRDEEGRTE